MVLATSLDGTDIGTELSYEATVVCPKFVAYTGAKKCKGVALHIHSTCAQASPHKVLRRGQIAMLALLKRVYCRLLT